MSQHQHAVPTEVSAQASIAKLASVHADLVANGSASAADLAGKIFTHERARQAFAAVAEAEDGAEQRYKAGLKGRIFKGVFKTHYDLGLGEQWVRDEISIEVSHYIEKMKASLGEVDADMFGAAEEKLRKVERQRLDELERTFATAMADYVVINEQYGLASDAELEALSQVCQHACSTASEYKQKADYLLQYHSSARLDEWHIREILVAMGGSDGEDEAQAAIQP